MHHQEIQSVSGRQTCSSSVFLKYHSLSERLSWRGTKHLPTRSWRLKRMGTAGLGLLALVLQLVLSFGHIHHRDLPPPRAFAGVAAVGNSSQPSQEQIPSGLPDDDCPICATMHMAASALPPVPPSIAGPVDFAHVLHRTSLEAFGLGVTRHILFQTRAPPTA
jgi:hypothetical protein